MTLTAQQLSKVFPNNKNTQALADALNKVLPKYEINTKNRIDGFLAQCGHESNGFTVLQENLNYSADGLVKIFSKYFTTTTAAQYARQPAKIANKVYANRMGNGAEVTGEGYMYRGRGAIQLTGKTNYQAFSIAVGKTLTDVVKYLETLEGAVESAAWFWKMNGLNEIADKKDIVAMTKKINGGVIGIVERQDLYNVVSSVIV